LGFFGRLRIGRDHWRLVCRRNSRGVLIMQKLTFNDFGWIVIAIERTGNYLQHIRFDNKRDARAFLKANPDAWFCG